jgi:hypothetical protein
MAEDLQMGTGVAYGPAKASLVSVMLPGIVVLVARGDG